MKKSLEKQNSNSSIAALVTAIVFLIGVAGASIAIILFVVSRNQTDVVDKYPEREPLPGKSKVEPSKSKMELDRSEKETGDSATKQK